MPLNEYGEKLDSNGYAPSILHDKPVCLICGRYGTARHEVYFGSAYRAKSKRLGLWVTLCPWRHQNGPTAIHNNRDADLRLKCWAHNRWNPAFRRTHSAASVSPPVTIQTL